SSAERLTSSIRRRWRRTLASSSLSLSSGFAGGAGTAGSAVGSGNTVQDTPSSAAVAGSSTTAGSGTEVRRAVKRPTIAILRIGLLRCSPGQRDLDFLCQRRDRRCRRFCARRQDQLLELSRDLVARFHRVERNAAVDSFADEPVVVRNARGEG